MMTPAEQRARRLLEIADSMDEEVAALKSEIAVLKGALDSINTYAKPFRSHADYGVRALAAAVFRLSTRQP